MEYMQEAKSELEIFGERRMGADSADEVLGEYAMDFMNARLGTSSLIHRDAAVKSIIAAVIFAVILFFDAASYMMYHRIKELHFVILAVAVIAFWITLRKFNTKQALLKKMAAMPDADVDNVLITECSSMMNKTVVNAIRAGVIVLAAAALFLLFRTPHMVFEENGTGYGLRYYSMAFSPDPEIVIPDTWKGKPVTEIRGSVFTNLNSFETVQLPSGITEIRGNTFENCKGLRRIVIPEGVTRIGGHAFYGCSSLSEVTLPSTVREIGSSAFRQCSKLRNIRIPKGCSVNARAFKESPTRIEYCDPVSMQAG